MGRFVCAVAISVLGLLVVGCSGGASPSSPTTAGPSPPAAVRLGDLVAFRGPAEITYRWSCSPPACDQGTLIWRLNGNLSRWDALTKASASPTEGTFVVIKQGIDTEQTFGCIWTAVAGDRSKVYADCGQDAGGAALMEGMLGFALPLFADRYLTASGARTILGRRIPCYTGGGIEKICVDREGRVLYFADGTGGAHETYEATSVLPAIEPFDWPFASLSSPTPVTGDLPADVLQFPQDFHLPR